MSDPLRRLQDAWSELAVCLRARFRALSEEMRSYPTPIARCDEQLTDLLAQRDALRAELERIARVDACGGVATSRINALEPFAAEGAADDAAVAAIRSRLANALRLAQAGRGAAVPRFLPSFPISEWK